MARFFRYNIKQVYGNVAARIMLFVFLGILLISFCLIYMSYCSHITARIDKELTSLRLATRSIAMHIDAKAHMDLMTRFEAKDAISEANTDKAYQELNTYLRESKEVFDIEGDIYTIVKSQHSGQFQFAVTSATKPYFRHDLQLAQQVHSLSSTAGQDLGPYTTETGTWLSSYCPILHEGKTVAFIQADLRFNKFLSEVRTEFLSTLAGYLFVFFIACIILLKVIDNTMAKQEFMQLKLMRQTQKVETRNKDIMDSIAVAKRLQDAVLPSKETLYKCFPELSIMYQPKDLVSGDFYWSEQVGSKTYLAVGDCTGHGIPGAFMSMMAGSALFYVLNKEQEDLGLMLKELDNAICKHVGDSSENGEGMDIALCCYDNLTGKMRYAGAFRPILHFRDNELQKIEGSRKGIGGEARDFDFQEHTINTVPGDVLYMYSDGYSDQFGGAKGRKYMSTRFRDFLSSIQDHPLEEQAHLLRYEFNLWKAEEEQVDDVLVLGFKVPEPGSKISA